MREVNTCYRNTMINLEFFLPCKCSDIKDLISELPNMFLSKMSLLDSVEHDPKQLSMLVYFGMDVISKSLISEHLQGKQNSKFIIVFL